MVMGEHLDFPDNIFDGTIACGVLTVGHAPVESFDELIRCTCPGGYIIFSVRADAHNFKEKQDKLEQKGHWKLINATRPFAALPLGEPGLKHIIYVYMVT